MIPLERTRGEYRRSRWAARRPAAMIDMRLPRTLAGAILGAAIAMAAYEWLGRFLDRYLGWWQSSLVTVAMAALCAGLAMYAGLRRHDRVHGDLRREVAERRSAQERLVASEERYRGLFDHMGEGFTYCRMLYRDGKPDDFEYLTVNAAYEALTGNRDATGRRASEVMPGLRETDPDLLELYGRVASTGRPERSETYVKALDMWRSMSVYCPEPGYFVAVFDVITERKRSESALRESEERYRRLFGNMAEGFAYCRVLYEDGIACDFEYLAVNAAFENLTGLRNVVGLRASEVIPGIREADPDLLRIYDRVATTGTPERFEVLLQSLGMWFSVSAYCPQAEHFVAVFDVVTERKRTEQALRDSEEQYRSLYASMSEGVALHDLVYDADGRAVDYRVVDVNPAYERTVGLTRGQVVGKLASEVYGPGTPPFLDVYAEVAETGQPTSFDVPYEPLSKTFHISVFSPSPGRFATVFLDTTDRDRLQQQLLEAQKMESLGRLAGGIAHDFNNLLTVVIGYAEMAETSTAQDDPVRAYAGNIRSAANHAASLTQQLLAFSRRQPAPTTVSDLNEVILTTSALLARLIREDIKILKHTPAHPVFVKADLVQLQQVLMNLVTNARDAMPDGGTIAIDVLRETVTDKPGVDLSGLAPGDYGVLRVADTGVGMSSEVRGRAFEPFFTTKEAGRGTGLGLATCYGIVERAGGCIRISSPLGIGTTLSVYLPVAESRVLDSIGSEAHAQAGGGTETVLVVEDEEALLELALSVLGAHGYSTLRARDGEEALDVLRGHPGRVDLVITDMIMPNMSGVELARRIACKRPDTTIMFVSGYSGATNDGPGLDGYEGAFLSKPFRPVELLSAVRRLLDRAKQEIDQSPTAASPRQSQSVA